MTKTHLVIPDQHAHPDHHNERADWLAKLIKDVKPDVVINLGDGADMPSLSGFDRGTKSFVGRNYMRDINAHLEFEDRLWGPVRRSKKKLPYRVYMEGNHDHRIKRAINERPELDGAVCFSHLRLSDNYDYIGEYNGNYPSVHAVDGVHYAHFFLSGVMGRPVGGEHAAYSLLTKEFVSCTCGHIHTADFSMRTTVDGRKIMGLVAGVFQDYDSDWAGEINRLWWRGVVVKRNVENGVYDPQFVSLAQLAREYRGK